MPSLIGTTRDARARGCSTTCISPTCRAWKKPATCSSSRTVCRSAFAALPVGGRLIIGETGFGTGLNFLCAWQLFEQHAVAGARLHFVSVEKYPLSHADLQRALALWPELKPLADQLLAQYIAIHQGFQRLVLDHGRVTLTLLVGDALEQLPQLDAQVDAWFLDGFAPAKNPDMWTAELFAELARLAAQARPSAPLPAPAGCGACSMVPGSR